MHTMAAYTDEIDSNACCFESLLVEKNFQIFLWRSGKILSKHHKNFSRHSVLSYMRFGAQITVNQWIKGAFFDAGKDGKVIFDHEKFRLLYNFSPKNSQT